MPRRRTWYLVSQEGGSSTEGHYLNLYASRRAADSFIDACNKASYRCIGPVPIRIEPDWLGANGQLKPGLSALLSSFQDMLSRLSRGEFAGTP